MGNLIRKEFNAKGNMKSGNLVFLLSVVFIITLILMFVFQWLKHVIWPQMNIWESHIITNVVFTLLITVVAYIIMYKQNLWLDRAVTEIENRKRIENALLYERDKFINILDAMKDGVFIVNKSCEIEYANPTLVKEFGFFSGRKCHEYFHGRKGICPACQNKDDFKDVVIHREVTFPRNRKTYDVLDAPLKNPEGFLLRLVILRDISDRKKAEEVLKRDKDAFEKQVDERTNELFRARAELEKARRLSDIGALAATVAHELRNPLAAIKIAAHNIKKKAENQNLDKHLANIDKKISESDQIIDNLLFYSRIKSPRYENTDIYEVVDECVSLLEEQHEKEGIVIEKNLEGLKNTYIEADTLQMKELFSNIMSNAMDSLINQEGKIEIIGELGANGSVKIHIKDNGCGIDKDELKRIHEPFYSTKAKGTGLGLTVCLQIVHLHDGNINIESEKGKGTSVCVTLPINKIKNGKESANI